MLATMSYVSDLMPVSSALDTIKFAFNLFNSKIFFAMFIISSDVSKRVTS